MKQNIEGTIAVIFVILFAIFLTMALTASDSGAMDPVEQQIHDESMIM